MNGPVDQMRELAVPGCFVRPLAVHEDRRGSFAKGFSAEQLAPLGLDIDVAELFWSWSHRGVIRGMHAQLPPRGAARVVICLSGRILDVVHDLRPGNEPKTDSVVLDGQSPAAVHVPVGVAHGFQVLSETALVAYLASDDHAPDYDTGVRWDSFGMVWPIMPPILSDRDAALPTGAELLASTAGRARS